MEQASCFSIVIGGQQGVHSTALGLFIFELAIDAQEQRTDADYSLTPNITSKKAQDIIEKAQRMLNFAQENIETV